MAPLVVRRLPSATDQPGFALPIGSGTYWLASALAAVIGAVTAPDPLIGVCADCITVMHGDH